MRRSTALSCKDPSGQPVQIPQPRSMSLSISVSPRATEPARLAQFFLVCAQRRNNPFGRVHDKHCSTREKRWESVFGLLSNG